MCIIFHFYSMPLCTYKSTIVTLNRYSSLDGIFKKFGKLSKPMRVCWGERFSLLLRFKIEFCDKYTMKQKIGCRCEIFTPSDLWGQFCNLQLDFIFLDLMVVANAAMPNGPLSFYATDPKRRLLYVY